MGKWFSAFVFVLSLFLPAFYPLSAAAESTVSPIVINEIQTGGVSDYGEDSAFEFIEIYNLSDQAISIDGWRIQYFASGRTDVFDESSSASSGREFILQGAIEANEIFVLSSLNYLEDADAYFGEGTSGNWLAKTGGHIRLLKVDKELREIIDVVGWGSASSPETNSALAPENGNSIERYIDCISGQPIDTDDNNEDFTLHTEPSPAVIGNSYKTSCEADPIPELPSCDGVTITEILPNPAGDDNSAQNNEYIELHNPTSDIIELSGCSLIISGKSMKFEFASNLNLQAGQYQAFLDSETKLNLPNLAGGEVVLSSATTDYAYQYPGRLKDNEAWAVISGEWQVTNNPTPNAANQPSSQQPEGGRGGGDAELKPCEPGKYRNPETNRCKSMTSDARELKPCLPGQFRNPETNRCKNISNTASSLVPCKPGQQRNPETNRCRSSLAGSSTLKPCASGQERNPETNRCRKVAAVASTLKPCIEGQERNPETNRCRKVSASSNSTGFDEKKADFKNAANYGIIGLVGSSAVGYGLYEYRNDVRNKLSQLKSRFIPGRSGK